MDPAVRVPQRTRRWRRGHRRGCQRPSGNPCRSIRQFTGVGHQVSSFRRL